MRQVLGCAGRRFGHVTMAAVRHPVMVVGLLRQASPLMTTFTLWHRWTVVLSSPMRSGGRAQSAWLQERQDWIVCPVARRRAETTRGAVAAEEATPNPTLWVDSGPAGRSVSGCDSEVIISARRRRHSISDVGQIAPLDCCGARQDGTRSHYDPSSRMGTDHTVRRLVGAAARCVCRTFNVYRVLDVGCVSR